MKIQESLDANQGNPSEPRLYTVAELRRRIAALQKATLIWSVVGIVGLFAYCAVLGVIFQYVLPAPDRPPHPVLGGIVMILVFLGQVLVIGCALARLGSIHRRSQVTCEHCRKNLDVGDFDFAIAIHGCPHCQNALFQEWNTRSAIMSLPDAAGSVKGEFTFADIREGDRKRNRAERRWFVLVMIIAAVVAAFVLGITAAAAWIWYDLLTSRFGDLASEVAKILCPIPAAVVLGVGIFRALCRAPVVGPKCGGCGSSIVDGECIRATGNCWTCGRRVIRDAPLLRCDDDRPDGKRIERAELAASVAHYNKWMPRSIVIIFGIAGLACWLILWWFGITGKPERVTMLEALVNLACISVGICVLLMVLFVVERCLKRKRCCPYCNQSLLARASFFARITGNCCHCGRRVLAPAE